jgi:hypothetical protein
LLRAAGAAVAKIGVVGRADGAEKEMPQPPTRRYTISVADYFTHGEVDFQIGVLLNDGRVVDIDMYQARFQSETEIKEALAQAGDFNEHPRDDAVRAYKERMRGSEPPRVSWRLDVLGLSPLTSATGRPDRHR